jgi:hypothetical protein
MVPRISRHWKDVAKMGTRTEIMTEGTQMTEKTEFFLCGFCEYETLEINSKNSRELPIRYIVYNCRQLL